MTLLKFSRRITRIFVLLLALSPTQVAFTEELGSQLPNLGNAGAGILSPAQERQLGQEFMNNVRQRFNILEDTLANLYLQDLADRLLSQLSNHDQEIRVFIVNDPSINAFAGPGGYIGVHTGLILTAHNEAELASVLAHEIAHVVQRHLLRRFEASQQQSLQTMGAIIAAILIGGSSPEASQAIMTSAIAGSAQQQLSYSRAHEQEADRIGLELLANADFDPRAMVGFFSTLQKQQRVGESNAPEFIRTHPLTTSRIADAEDRASRYPLHASTENPSFQFIQARIAALTEVNSNALSTYKQRIHTEASGQQAERYLQALTAFSKGDYPQARELNQTLLATDSERILFHYNAAEIELADNQASKAADILSGILQLFPGNVPLTELYAKTLLQLGKPQQAFTLLKEVQRQKGIYPSLNKLYAESAMKSGKPAESYRALAEMHYAQGNPHQAIDYLELALKQDGTLTELERLSLQSRLKTLKSESNTEK